MKWSKEPPTEPGWYWIRSIFIKPEVIEVYREGLGVLVVSGSSVRGLRNEYPIVELLEREWAGPIPQPEEEL